MIATAIGWATASQSLEVSFLGDGCNGMLAAQESTLVTSTGQTPAKKVER